MHEFRYTGGACLFEDLPAAFLNGPQADVKAAGDGLIGRSSHYQVHHVSFLEAESGHAAIAVQAINTLLPPAGVDIEIQI